MRWLPFSILAYLTLGIQTGLRDNVAIRGASPNLVLIAAVFIAINAPSDAALLGCVMLGLCQDLLTSNPPGLYAVAYGLVGLFVVSTQEWVYRDHFLTHVSMTLIGGLLCSGVFVVHGWLYPMMHRGEAFARPHLGALLATTLYTAAVAPFVLGLIGKTRRFFSFRPIRVYSVRRGMRSED